jgi:uncharacterized protein YkwD
MRARKQFGALSTAALLVVLSAFATAPAGALAAPGAETAAVACAGEYAAPTGHNAALVDTATLCVMNRVRVTHGLRTLRFNRVLGRIASGQAKDMVRGGYFGDQSLSGQSPLSRILASNYPARTANVRLLTAQNIGWGTGPNATPVGIVRAWMLSPPHRQIILTPAYRDVGVGVAPSVPSQLGVGWLGGTYAVEFGSRRR